MGNVPSRGAAVPAICVYRARRLLVCPNASMRELRHLYNAHPDLWQLLLELQDAPNKATERFNRSYTLHDLDLRFSLEGEQLSFFTYGER